MTLRALVVVESMFGNTEQVAGAVAVGSADGGRRRVVDVAAAPVDLPADLDLLVLGGPTHAFSMSRPHPRADAVRRGRPPNAPTTGLREWLERAPAAAGRVPGTRRLRHAGPKVRRLPRRRTPRRPARPPARSRAGRQAEGFLVADTAGPLVDGELERARRGATVWPAPLVGRAAAGRWTPATSG